MEAGVPQELNDPELHNFSDVALEERPRARLGRLSKNLHGSRTIMLALQAMLVLNHPPMKLQARLLGRGYEQRQGIDYEENFTPIVKWSTI